MHRRFLTQFDRERVPVESAARWFAGNPSLEHIQDSESFVYRISDGSCRRYLRVTNEGHRSAEMILAELEFVEHLAAAAVPVARPQTSWAGPLLETIDSNGHRYFACMFAEAPGSRLSWKTANWNTESFRRWGAALGRIHAASTSFTSPRNRRFGWNEDDVWARAEQYLPASEIAARRELDRLRDWLANRPQTPEQFGMIHGDLCAANFHVSEEAVTAFDFDDCSYHWFLYDVVCAVTPAAFRPAEERRALRSAIVEGYQQTYKLPPHWEAQFGWYLRMRGLFLFVLNHRNSDGDMVGHPKRAFLDLLRLSFDQPVEW